jgi:outer membrane lipoprotein-sorting protein
MKNLSLALTVALALGGLGLSAGPQPKPDDSAKLDSILHKMDEVSASFRTAQADFEWDNYQRVIGEFVDVQTGTVYYRRAGKDIEMMADVKRDGTSLETLKSEPKHVLFSDGKVRIYEPNIEQVTVYDLHKDRADVESYVVLGFGGSGQELQKAFEVAYQGMETVNSVNTVKLQLIPKSDTVKRYFNRMVLWIDPDKGLSVQQKFLTPQEDYKLCKYSNIKLNEKLDSDVFKLKTTGKTKIVSPAG